MTFTIRSLLHKTLTFAFIAVLATPLAYGVGPLMEGMEIFSFGPGPQLLQIPGSDGSGGILHGLEAEDWCRFRLKVTHSESASDAFFSDGFAPTSEDIQICSETGCEALPISLGHEDLDWLDSQKTHYYLQAKACMLCQWIDHEITPL